MKNGIFTIQVLDDKNYEALHEVISDVGAEDLRAALCFAIKDRGEAYVRKTGVAELDESTMQHELQELLAKNSEHEDENNIRWKKGGALRTILPIAAAFIPGIGPLLAAGLNVGMNQYAQSRHPEELGPPSIGSALVQGVSGYMGGKAAGGAVSGAKAGMQAGKSLGGILGSAVQGAGTGTFTTPAGQSTSLLGGQGLLGGSAPLGLVSPTSAANMGIVKPNTANLLGSPSGLVGPATEAQAAKGAASLAQVPVSPVSGGVAGAGTPSLMEGVGKSLIKPETILGAGSLMASQAPKTPQFEMPSQVADIQAKLMQGEALSPLGQQARSELSKIMASKPSELYPTANDEFYNAALRRTRQSYATAEEQLDAAYNNAGMYGSGEHLAAKAKLKEELARTESGLAAETEQRRFELARTAQYTATQDALGVDKNVMDDLAGLTGLDVQTAAMIYGAKTADVQAIRENLGTLGVELLLRGQGVQKSGGLNINIGQGNP